MKANPRNLPTAGLTALCVVGSCMELDMAALGPRLDAVPPRLDEKAEGAPRNRTPGTPCQYNGSDNFFMIRTA